MANLGFVGLGVMGGQMVSRLLDKGHTVTGHNRTKSKAQWLIDKGMRWGDSPRAVCEAADVTFSMVTNSAALEGIAHGLPAGDPRIPALLASAGEHRAAALPAVTGEHYEGGHWLGTFAVYLTSAAGLR